MPRPPPDFENTPITSSVSLARKLRVAGAQLQARQPALGIRDFSDLITRALSDYIERQYPGLIKEIDQLLRQGATRPAPMAQMVSEAQGAYGPDQLSTLARKWGLTLDQTAELEQVLKQMGLSRRPRVGAKGLAKGQARRA